MEYFIKELNKEEIKKVTKEVYMTYLKSSGKWIGDDYILPFYDLKNGIRGWTS